MSRADGWQFWIDVGGTFTDCIARAPTGTLTSHKLLSTGVYKGRLGERPAGVTLELGGKSGAFPPDFFAGFAMQVLGATSETRTVRTFDAQTNTVQLDAPLTRPPAAATPYELASGEPAPVTGIRYLLGLPLTALLGPLQVRLGTTRGTNALLERQGATTTFVTTAGFGDVLAIAYQNRPQLFALDIRKPRPLYADTVEVAGRIDRHGRILRPLDEAGLTAALAEAKARGAEAVAICFLNAHISSVHEDRAAAIAAALGFGQISVSSRVAPLQRIVPRGDTTVVDAYLTPPIRDYVRAVRRSLPTADLKLMTSAGGLVDAEAFIGKDSILSGPAGGVVGVAQVAREAGIQRAIGFDMGGTSTDVSRYDGELERRFEMELADAEHEAGARIVAPMLAIETVAAGGGSVCAFDGIRLVVGPRSAGADPGPACYGKGGPLTITDCNLLLGRLGAGGFSFPLDTAAAAARLAEAAALVNAAAGGGRYTPESLAAGFLTIAASNMAQPIKKISLSRGYDVRLYTLVSFGGAGAQHACQLADELGMTHILVHPYASLLSAYGMGAAVVSRFAARDVGLPLAGAADQLARLFAAMTAEVAESLMTERAIDQASLTSTRYLDLRYKGQDSVITVKCPDDGDYAARFTADHHQLYGFTYPERAIEVRNARLEVTAAAALQMPPEMPSSPHAPVPSSTVPAWFGAAIAAAPVYLRSSLAPGAALSGPALITGDSTCVVVEPGWNAAVTARGLLELTRTAAVTRARLDPLAAPDPVTLALFSNQFTSVAEGMGAALQRTSLSVNVKERLDFSCAIFGPEGDLVVNAPHIPVHLGSMGDTVRAILREVGKDLRPGDVYVTNDPYRGGSHLPDVTVVTPVHNDAGALLFFTGNRAHHAEIGGITPGSMPPHAHTLAEEGVLIRPFRLVRAGVSAEAALRRLLLDAPHPTRAVEDNIADINAQVAANALGRQRLLALVAGYGLDVVQAYMRHIRHGATLQLQRALCRVTPGTYRCRDAMDDGTAVEVAITISHAAGAPASAKAVCDFTGTGGVSAGNLNANSAIVKAATLYVFRCLIAAEIPLNEGVLAPLSFVIPAPSLLSPPGGDDWRVLPAVTAGNVETSQRLVDVLLGALGLAAASQGTMNNVLFGRSATPGRPAFGYYETICGGAGAGPGFAGASAVHTHMTNTRITDPEVLEERFPVRVQQFAIRPGSGGAGRWRGGDGVTRALEFLGPMTLSLITSRRTSAPYGLAGGEPGLPGRNLLLRANGTQEVLPSMAQVEVAAGDVLVIETPGGGGYGTP